MIQVLIVDDEKSNREGLKYLIDWQEYDCEVRALAKNGLEALEIMNTEQIDLVIADIRMPGMDGIELLRKVREVRGNDIEFIFLSGYGEFQYAREAINFGVRGYLLKPIEELELYDLLNQIRQDRAKKLMDLEKDKWNELDRIIRLKDPEIARTSQYFHSKEYYYVSINLEEEAEMHKILDALEIQLGYANLGYIISKEKKAYGIIVSDDLLERFNNNIRTMCEELYEALRSIYSHNIAILIGKKVDNLYEIDQSRDTISQCEFYLFYKGYNSIIDYEDIKDMKIVHAFENNTFLEELSIQIKQQNIEGIKLQVHSLCQQLKEKKVELNIVRMYINHIILGLEDWLRESGCQVTAMDRLQHQEIIEIQAGMTIHRVEKQLVQYCEKLIFAFEQARKNRDLGVIGEILDYIALNYSEDLNIKVLAAKYYLNASYLGQLFRKKTGVGVKTYLQKVRMEESKKLLSTTNLKIYEISHRVGYDDSNYFVTKFIELEGMSPSTYRKTYNIAKTN